MSYVMDSRLPSLMNTLSELIEDKETNETIELCINKFFGNECSQLIDDRYFIYNFFSKLIHESLVKGEANEFSFNESCLSQRCKLMAKFVYNYREYQLNLLLVLCELKVGLGLSDQLFDAIIKTMYTNGVVSEDAFNHWFQCKSGFQERMKIIGFCTHLLKMSQEAREDLFYLST